MSTITVSEQWHWVFADCNEEVPVLLFISYLTVISAILVEEHQNQTKHRSPNRDFLDAMEKFSNILATATYTEDRYGMDQVRTAHARMSLPEGLLKLMASIGVDKINDLPDYVNSMLKKRQIFICDTEVKFPGGAIVNRIQW